LELTWNKSIHKYQYFSAERYLLGEIVVRDPRQAHITVLPEQLTKSYSDFSKIVVVRVELWGVLLQEAPARLRIFFLHAAQSYTHSLQNRQHLGCRL
jgi:hypothetical protein